MYFKKCWQGVLYQHGKFNYRAYNYVRNMVINYFGNSDLYKIYKYLVIINPQNMTVIDCLEKARKYAEDENAKAEKAKIKAQNITAYNDDLLGELL